METRGRKRDAFLEEVAEDVRHWHEFGSLTAVARFVCPHARHEAHRFRNGTAYKDLQKEFGDIFRVSVLSEVLFTVRYREGMV